MVNLPRGRPIPVPLSPPLPYTNDPYHESNFLMDDEFSDVSADSDDARKRTKKHNDRASRQHARNNPDPAAPSSGAAVPVIPGETQLHGCFHCYPIDNVADATELISTAMIGDDALRYLNFLNTQLQLSTRNHTEGQHKLITRWNSFIAFNGKRRDRARIAAGIPVSKKTKRILPPPPAAAGSTTDKMEIDEAPPVHVSSADHQAWIAGLRLNQRGFANTSASQWPAGIRQMVNDQAVEVPRNIGNIFLEPHEGDCIAVLTSRQLAPLRISRDHGSNIHRQEFLRAWWGTFRTPGLFARIAQELGLSVGDREFEHFPYDTRNMDVITVVQWALDHCIRPTSRTAGVLEEYAPFALARQASLADFPWHTPDQWVSLPGQELHEESHSL